MKLRIESKANGKLKVDVERDDGTKLDFDGERDDFLLDFQPVEGKEDDEMIVNLYARFRVKHPKDDGTPTVKDVKK